MQANLDKVISEIDTNEFDDDLVRQFIEHRVISLAFGVHTYSEMIVRKVVTKEEESKFNKNLSVYNQIESTLAQRAYEYSTEELFNQLVAYKKILDANIQN
ncbi:hypothetical protein [Pseudoalteromonas sp. meg-B1]|uniref:hypothetical protein n=1 Tax=Pseudoalteromonas sp. meg-B1 TaxID=2203192 RepID=UPI000D6F57A9|nr:hypothetical protein [Pseudoalteromonas sp. meg-B1]PWS56342.1 hypothetical protein DK924_06280 [Pseudoalteromonas sp. meg-B1]